MSNYDANIDYLQEDDIINGQQYCCLSFVEPAEEVEKHLEVYIFNQFLKHISKNFILTPRISEEATIQLEQEQDESLNQNPVEEKKEEASIQEITIEEIKEGTKEEPTEEPTEELTEEPKEKQKEEKPENELIDPKVCHKKLFGEYIGFKSVNYTKLMNKYVEKYGDKTCIRGIKVRGSYRSLVDARKRASSLQKLDENFNVFVGQVGCWCPFNPVNLNDVSPEYYEQQLNQLVHNKLEDTIKKDQLFNQRKNNLKNRGKEKKARK